MLYTVFWDKVWRKPHKYCCCTVPKRNWNHRFSCIKTCNDFSVVLYLWGIETWITFSFFILHLICGSVPLRNISHKNFWVFFCDAQLRKLCIRISIFIDGLKKRVPLCRWQRELLFLLFKLVQFKSKMIYQVVSLLISWWRSHVHIQNLKGVILSFIAFYSRAI